MTRRMRSAGAVWIGIASVLASLVVAPGPAAARSVPRTSRGAIFRLAGPKANRLRPAVWTSADAAGLPIFAGLLRYDEVKAGLVDHAIRMTVGCTHDGSLWPARHAAGTIDRRCPPMGARFRLRASFAIGRFGPSVRVVL